MADDSDLEKTESPSQRRLDKAREEGQVPRSRELSTFLVMFCAAIAFVQAGQGIFGHLSSIVRHGLTISRADAFDASTMARRFNGLATEALSACTPIFIVLTMASLGAAVLMGGWIFTPGVVAPQLSRINPMSGLGRIISSQGLVELIKALGKTALLVVASAVLLWNSRDAVMALGETDLRSGITAMGRLLTHQWLWLCAALALIALADAPFQMWRHHSKLKMTKQELRDESRESEGDPAVKGRIRNLQRAAARRRMMSKVPSADVVVINPTHFSVAISYKESMRAPRVVAKGTELVALRIRELARENQIPILEAPPLARALYKHTNLDQEIPVSLYEAVAQVMAYVFQLRRFNTQGGAVPILPNSLPIPDGLDPGVENPA